MPPIQQIAQSPLVALQNLLRSLIVALAQFGDTQITQMPLLGIETPLKITGTAGSVFPHLRQFGFDFLIKSRF